MSSSTVATRGTYGYQSRVQKADNWYKTFHEQEPDDELSRDLAANIVTTHSCCWKLMGSFGRRKLIPATINDGHVHVYLPQNLTSLFSSPTDPSLDDGECFWHVWEPRANIGDPKGLRIGTESENPFRARILKKLSSYEDLPENWNGYGGKTPSLEAIAECKRYLRRLGQLSKWPDAMVGGNGEVGLYWDTPDVSVEIGFIEPGKFGYLVDFRDGRSEENENVPILQNVPLLMEAIEIFR